MIIDRNKRRNRLLALLPVLPLLAFIGVTFVAPLGTMLSQSLYDPRVADIMPDTVAALQESWSGEGLPREEIYAAAVRELIRARKNRTVGQLATRLNRQTSGSRSLITRTARKLLQGIKPPYSKSLPLVHSAWGKPDIWRTLRAAGDSVTARYYLNALDLRYDANNDVVAQPESRRIYVSLFIRTLWVSLAITLLCLVIGYPIAYMIAQSPPGRAKFLLMLVLLPFWTSLLVRTTAWIVLLQQQGVVNDVLVWIGFIENDERLTMIHNMAGTLIAMTHILVPFMVLPLYAVMKGIPEVQMQAAHSLGAGWVAAFRKVYLPQTLPGVGAGCLLVFILAIGYYITPALVGGQSGQLISNLIAYHMQSSLNWNLAAALGTILFFAVILLFTLYDRVLGLDRMRLGA